MLNGRQILLGLTGSIAAYKSALLTRLLIKKGCGVQVIMTESAMEFISALTMSTLSGKPVIDSFTGSAGVWNNHVAAALNSDAILIAPATANTLAKMANGICDHFLLAVCLSARCPVFVAPAMDKDMLSHESTQHNMKLLSKRGVQIIQPDTGELASGLTGEGRMAEPEHILDILVQYFSDNLPLKGKTVLVTAGPTWEQIDPVRFVANRSSGKMGFALAEQACSMGAQVTLITGPTHLKTKGKNIQRIDVLSAEQMYNACLKHYKHADICMMAAAVADYTVPRPASKKIKKSGIRLTIELRKTKDILKKLGQLKSTEQILVGFALETDQEMKHARKKLKEKNLDMIVLNSLNDANACFESDQNKVTLICSDGCVERFALKSKKKVAEDIFNKILHSYVA